MRATRTFSVLAAAAVGLVFSSAARADEFALQNSAAFGNGPISTVDLTTNTVVGNFIPQSATTCTGGNCNGRGVALLGGFVYYTELDGGSGQSDGIYIANWNNGAGSANIGFITNPTPGTGIVDVKGNGGFLYIMTGYPNGPEIIDKMSGVGTLISSVTLTNGSGADLTASDGFTILPNGNYLINEGDADNSYDQYNPITGVRIAGTNIADAPSVCGTSTGVDTDGTHLFFSCNFNSVEETDFTGAGIENFSDPGFAADGGWEDISLNQAAPITPPGTVPEPMTLSLFGAGIVGAFAMRRRKKNVA
jgi:hypothetical protein